MPAPMDISVKYIRDTLARCHPRPEASALARVVCCEELGLSSADYFLMSTNAITRTGELVNIDGASNRLSSLLHGPKHVIIVAGMNKLVKTVEDGFNRIQTSVCPVTAERSGRKTPCGIKGVCTDCQSPDCMCCNIVISRRSRYNGRVKVILVGENLGV